MQCNEQDVITLFATLIETMFQFPVTYAGGEECPPAGDRTMAAVVGIGGSHKGAVVLYAPVDFARQIAEIEAGKKKPVIDVGNLDAERDFTDVRDMVRAYALAAEKCAPGETYNICMGRPRRIGEVLGILLALSSVRIEVRQDTARLRESDVPVFYGDCAKFARATGWRPEHPIEETLREILDWWRGRVSSAL